MIQETQSSWRATKSAWLPRQSCRGHFPTAHRPAQRLPSSVIVPTAGSSGREMDMPARFFGEPVADQSGQLARPHRQIGLAATLNLAVLVDAQGRRPLRRRGRKERHVAQLGHELGIGGKLERLQPMRPQAKGALVPRDARRQQPTRLGHAARTPMGPVPWHASNVLASTASMRPSSVLRSATVRGASPSPQADAEEPTMPDN